MKKAIIICLIIVEFLMGVCTYLVYDSESGALFFSGGSIGSTMKVFSPNFWIVFLLFVVTVSFTIILRKKIKYLLLSFLIFFSLWFFFGRTIGVHWTGEIYTGWFFINSDKVILCENIGNCSDDVIENTSLSSTFPFQLKFVHDGNEKVIFVGPTIGSDLKNYFDQNKKVEPPK